MNIKDTILEWGIASGQWAGLLAAVIIIAGSVAAGMAVYYLTVKGVAPLVIKISAKTATK